LGRLFYAALVDLGDTVADQLSLPIDTISLEMIYRGLYHFYVGLAESVRKVNSVGIFRPKK